MCHQAIDQILSRCQGAYSDLTLSGYRCDLLHFAQWCLERDLEWAPASPTTLATFIDAQISAYSIATIKRRVEAVKFAHRMLDLVSPARHSEVCLALRRASRSKQARPKQSLGLTSDLLRRILAACPATLAGRRDAALISVGYDTLCRSVELVAIQVKHLKTDLSSLIVPRSKADPFGIGRIAYLSPTTQNLVAQWLEASMIEEGPLFGGLHTRKLSGEYMNTASIRRIVKRAARRAKVSQCEANDLSGHSMRIGAAQDMMVAGIDHIAIMHAGGWKSIDVLARYVENASGSQIHARRWQRLEDLQWG
jgi:integrase/recombinase XerD